MVFAPSLSRLMINDKIHHGDYRNCVDSGYYEILNEKYMSA